MANCIYIREHMVKDHAVLLVLRGSYCAVVTWTVWREFRLLARRHRYQMPAGPWFVLPGEGEHAPLAQAAGSELTGSQR